MKKIKILEKEDLDQLAQLITNSQATHYIDKLKIDKDNVSDYVSVNLDNFTNIPGNNIIGLTEKNEIVAFCAIKPSVVETNLFNKKIFCIDTLFSAGTYQCSFENKQELLKFFHLNYANYYDMASCRVDSHDFSGIHAMEKNSFLLMDGLITYTMHMPHFRKGDQCSPCRIRVFMKNDLTKIEEIAQKSFTLDRFHNDSRIPGRKSDLLYRAFVRNASKGIGADRVLVAECNGEVSGFNTIEIKNRLLAQFGIIKSTFVLNAVSPEYRNRGVYSSLIYESLNNLSGHTDEVEIRIHVNNFPAHRVLSRIGFIPTRSQVTFHRWNLTKPRRNNP
jgi:RimJ/RimL family protein N-acetyltransferase